MGSKEKRFDTLVDAYSTRLYRYAYWLCGDRDVAEDLLQETFMRAWRALDSLRDESAAKTWLFTIAQRENARRFNRDKPAMIEYDDSTPAFEIENCPEHVVERELMQRAIMSLKLDYREPLVMQILGGFTCEEIALALNLNKGVVMTRLFRAKRKLGDLLSTPSQASAAHKP
jgi:RNA polymerase sigma-70 factor (ECF subfamily)